MLSELQKPSQLIPFIGLLTTPGLEVERTLMLFFHLVGFCAIVFEIRHIPGMFSCEYFNFW